jgi:hypothetical protein
MSTNPTITKRLEKFDALISNPHLVHYQGETALIKAFFAEAMTEAYLAGMNEERRNNIDTAFEVAEIATDVQYSADLRRARKEAQRETAREIVDLIQDEIDRIGRSEADGVVANAHYSEAKYIKHLITSKYLQPEDKPNT